ncbi:THO complex subunit 1 isoform X1 [Nasonia vitripennis]|uniref:Death domain-containing protein n=1 Tax=Nasonia vitripennis TaxID=7425 RepID=A0A7M7HAC6_NASVI|nr:THO complex subunit 1 isoform X1 [Nasonia vitripennis]
MASFETLRKDYSKYVQQCLKSSDIATFQKKTIEQCANDKDRKPAIDQALRDTLVIILSNNATNNTRTLESYIKFCIELCRKDLATTSMPVMLLSDMFDALTLNLCEDLFTYVENNVSTWKEDLFFGACKNNLLRMCNDLLRRLSRSQQTVFCGRILLFLAKFFPFSERSGLNIVSEFNLENITEFGSEKSEEEVIQQMEVDGEKSETKISIDYNLYRKFWALQDFFRNPNQCYNKMHWKCFSTHATNVLSTFASFKLEDQKDCIIDHLKIESLLDGRYKDNHYFAKYLTNEKLLELQLSDSNFRRFVLLQFLILFQYLNSTVKFKSETHELKPDQVEWVNTTTEQVYLLLTETPPDGAAFAEAVKHILKREEYWNSWKNEGCPAFKRPAPEPMTEADEARKPKRLRRKIGDLIRDAQAVGKYYMGNQELTKLWNLCPNNLEACKSKDRDFLPSLETYFEEAIEQLDPAAAIEDEYKKVNDGNFGWRALRLLARRSPHFFVHGNYPINKLQEYLEIMIKKIAKDRPVCITNQVQTDIKQEAGETPPSEQIEQDFNEETLKQETEAIESKPKVINRISRELVEKLAEVMKDDWETLAAKLGYTNDEIVFFGKKQTPYEQCQEMLVIWTEEDPEASIEHLKSILQELNCTEALEVVNSNTVKTE